MWTLWTEVDAHEADAVTHLLIGAQRLQQGDPGRTQTDGATPDQKEDSSTANSSRSRELRYSRRVTRTPAARTRSATPSMWSARTALPGRLRPSPGKGAPGRRSTTVTSTPTSRRALGGQPGNAGSDHEHATSHSENIFPGLIASMANSSFSVQQRMGVCSTVRRDPATVEGSTDRRQSDRSRAATPEHVTLGEKGRDPKDMKAERRSRSDRIRSPVTHTRDALGLLHGHDDRDRRSVTHFHRLSVQSALLSIRVEHWPTAVDPLPGASIAYRGSRCIPVGAPNLGSPWAVGSFKLTGGTVGAARLPSASAELEKHLYSDRAEGNVGAGVCTAVQTFRFEHSQPWSSSTTRPGRASGWP